jgi:hypothetical protein
MDTESANLQEWITGLKLRVSLMNRRFCAYRVGSYDECLDIGRYPFCIGLKIKYGSARGLIVQVVQSYFQIRAL